MQHFSTHLEMRAQSRKHVHTQYNLDFIGQAFIIPFLVHKDIKLDASLINSNRVNESFSGKMF